MFSIPSFGTRHRIFDAGVWICDTCLRRGAHPTRRCPPPFPLQGKQTYSSRVCTRRSSTALRHPWQSFKRSYPAVAAPAKPSSKREPLIPKFPARTRFAPSPTGHLHIGGLRTALFSYLLAKRTGGQFVLRIEDTDQKRLVSGAEERLLEDLAWAGLTWDEGPHIGGPYGPYKQSERTPLYQHHARELLDNGSAYRCFCSAQTVDRAFVTSGCYQDCSVLPKDESLKRAEAEEQLFTVRLKPPENANKRIYPDLIYGKIVPLKRSPTALASAESETGIDAADTILIKSDGTPTYHFANVVDDHLMKITHVIRGTEWMASTPLHYDLYHAFGWKAPIFAHVGLLVDENKAKLSKRNTDVALEVKSMRDELGILPETLNNFLTLLGWSNPDANDVMSLTTLIENFDLKFTKGNTMVRMEKLWYLQKQHVAQRCTHAHAIKSKEPVRDLVLKIANEAELQYPEVFNPFNSDEELHAYCAEVLLADSKSFHNPKQYVNRNAYFFSFNPDRVPAPQNFYDKDKEITAAGVHGFVEDLLENFDFDQNYRELPFSNTSAREDSVKRPDTDSIMSAVDEKSAKLHAAFDYQGWRIVFQLIISGDTANTGTKAYKVDEEALPFTNQPVDVSACIHHFSRGEATEDEVLTIARRKKAWNVAVMKYLRERLSYGLPGPSVGIVMAILGYRECCRRLGVRPKEGGGW